MSTLNQQLPMTFKSLFEPTAPSWGHFSPLWTSSYHSLAQKNSQQKHFAIETILLEEHLYICSGSQYSYSEPKLQIWVLWFNPKYLTHPTPSFSAQSSSFFKTNLFCKTLFYLVVNASNKLVVSTVRMKSVTILSGGLHLLHHYNINSAHL